MPKALVVASKRIEYVSFKLSQADTVTVAVINAAGGEEATLVRDLPVERYKQVSLCWNGQRGPRERGGLAPPGEYRLRVGLRGRGSPVYSPEGFALTARVNGAEHADRDWRRRTASARRRRSSG